MSRSSAAPAREERSLAEAVEAGDPHALARLFECYALPMRRIALSITGCAMEAEDVVQEIFLHLPESIATFEGRCPLWGWLRRVTVLRARMAVRGRTRRGEAALPPDARARGSPDTRLERIALERALASLPERYRTVFLLRELEGLSHAEIARLLGTTVNVSCVTLSRARRRLRRILDPHSSRR